MDQYWRARKAVLLCALVLVGGAYGASLSLLDTITGDWAVDGIVGIVLGLYICSHPVANTIDLLFLERGVLGRAGRELSSPLWLTLNVLVLVAGWFVTSVGIMRFLG